MTEELYTLFSGNNKEELEWVVEYLTKEITMCRDYPPKIKENSDRNGRGGRDWLVVIPNHLKQFSNTIEKIRNAHQDFMEGLKIGLEKGKQRQIEYEVKLKEWRKGKTRLTPVEQDRLFEALNILSREASDTPITDNQIDAELIRLVTPRIPRYLKGRDIDWEHKKPDFYDPSAQLKMWKTLMKYKKILGITTENAQKALVECLPEHCERCHRRLKCIEVPK